MLNNHPLVTFYRHRLSLFLGATNHLYNWLCPTVGRSVSGLVGQSVGRSVGWSVSNAFVRRFTRRTYWPTWPCFLAAGPKEPMIYAFTNGEIPSFSVHLSAIFGKIWPSLSKFCKLWKILLKFAQTQPQDPYPSPAHIPASRPISQHGGPYFSLKAQHQAQNPGLRPKS